MKAQFGSKIGLIAATVGSAVGLGNIWRFPAEVQANGGAAFLIVYIACVFLLGIPVMLGEFALGRYGQTDAVGVYRKLSPGTPWWMTGLIGIVASYVILSFYTVVAGWTFEYLFQSITGELYETIPGDAPGSTAQFADRMAQYVSSTWKPILYTVVVIAINLGVLLKGVQKGIERLSNLLMPLLFCLLAIFVVVALQLPGAGEGLSFFLTPDFSKITPKVVIDALGQSFFSLSLGMGVLITYASYFPRDTRLTKTAVTVSVLDLLVAVMVGLIIFPAVMSFGLQGESFEGATLVFVTLPEVFARMAGTQIWSILFFLLLFVAALTSTISIGEVSVAYFSDHLKMTRKKACLAVMLPLLVFSPICSLSNGVLSDFRIFGMTIFSCLDAFSTNILLPLGGLLMSIYLGWVAPKGFMKTQLTNDGQHPTRSAGLVSFILKWIAPVLILIIFVAGLL
ncbi:MAG: sodium-dependent transporter [Bacteroides sp.]|nr:sodium-dependent transporter [Bacteroides sp.]